MRTVRTKALPKEPVPPVMPSMTMAEMGAPASPVVDVDGARILFGNDESIAVGDDATTRLVY